MVSMHRVSSTGNAANGVRPRKERRLTYVLSDSNDSKHCSGINCLRVTHSSHSGGGNNVLFSGSRDGTLKRWDITDEAAACSATFESHTDWVNDAVVVGETLVSCSSDTTIKTWQAFSDGRCTKTFRQHSDYVISLAAAKHTNTVASAGLGGEVFIWDLEAANIPVLKAERENADERSESAAVSRVSSSNEQTMSPSMTATQLYTPFAVKGHKESVYALAMNDAGTVLVSGGTEKAVRVWDPRTGTKKMKLKGHTENIRALLLDASGRLCLSGSSDSMIRLWDLGQQRCIHSYAVHTDSIWALASNSSFSHVYSGGRDLSVYYTDLVSRESLLVCSEQSPVLCLELENDDWLWSATSDSSIHKWLTKQNNKAKGLQKGSSFVAGTLPFARAKACLENSPAVPLNTEPTCVIPGTPGIIRHSVLNDRRHVLTKDAAGVVKLWEITRGAVIEDYGNVSFEEKEKELFEMISVPSWFTMDTRLGCISIHLDTPQCFSAEIYAVDLQVPGASEELKMNLGQETLKGLFAHWQAHKKERSITSTLTSPAVNGDSVTNDSGHANGKGLSTDGSQPATENQKATVSHAFEFSSSCPPSIITEGSQGGPWRKKISELDGSEDEKEIPTWCLECILYGRFSTKENMKCSFYLHPYEGTTVQVLTQGKLSAPRILRVHKVMNYVIEKMVIDKPPDENGTDSHDSAGSSQNNGSQLQTSNGGSTGHRVRAWQQKAKPKVEILCNNQALPPEMSLATVRQYVWKKQDDLALYFRVTF